MVVVLYARVSDKVATRLGAGAPTLRLPDWKSGVGVRVVKVIAPFGGGEKFTKETIQALCALSRQ